MKPGNDETITRKTNFVPPILKQLRWELLTNKDAGEDIDEINETYGDWLLDCISCFLETLSLEDLQKVSLLSILTHISTKYGLPLSSEEIADKLCAKILKRFIRVQSKPLIKSMYYNLFYNLNGNKKIISNSEDASDPLVTVSMPMMIANSKRRSRLSEPGSIEDLNSKRMKLTRDKVISVSGMAEEENDCENQFVEVDNSNVIINNQNKTGRLGVVEQKAIRKIHRTTKVSNEKVVKEIAPVAKVMKTPDAQHHNSQEGTDTKMVQSNGIKKTKSTVKKRPLGSRSSRSLETDMSQQIDDYDAATPGQFTNELLSNYSPTNLRSGRLRDEVLAMFGTSSTAVPNKINTFILQMEIVYLMSVIDMLKEVPRFRTKLARLGDLGHIEPNAVNYYVKILFGVLRVTNGLGISDNNCLPNLEDIETYVAKAKEVSDESISEEGENLIVDG
eukprot:GHVH01004486.1.p1 GENE.GHVH01004486.1~~GHVH01004486.1.p1  ORF type:complete len:447 (+),score=65.46 GHVH01004486.1:162-1502(+)